MKSIGIDAHSRHCVFAVMNKKGKLLETKRVPTTEKNILSFVRSIKGQKQVAFEEGIISHFLYVLLKNEVDHIVVCQATGSDGPKTDWIDAEETADLLRVGRLKPVHHEDSRFMDLRVLISGYADLNQEIVRMKNRYKALYRQIAIRTDSSDFYSSRDHIAKLKTVEQRYVASTLFAEVQLLEEHKRRYHRRFERNANTFPEIKNLMTIPGIGPVRANEIVGIMVTPYRFPTKYNLYSYAMLTRHKRTSDNREYGTRKPNGQRQLKAVFKAAVLSAVSADNAFARYHDQLIRRGNEPKSVRCKVAKKIAAATLGVWKSGEAYNDDTAILTEKRRITRQGKTII